MYDPADPNADRLVLLKVTDEGAYLHLMNFKTRGTCFYNPAELPPEARDFLKPLSTGLLTCQLDFDYDYWNAGDFFLFCRVGVLRLLNASQTKFYMLCSRNICVKGRPAGLQS